MPNPRQPELFNELFGNKTISNLELASDTEENHASRDKNETRGAIYTRTEVVDFILDLVGYVENEPLHLKSILEPSFGNGDFLLPVINRLLSSWRNFGGKASSAHLELKNTIRGVELHNETFLATRESVIRRLLDEGISFESAISLADQWLIQGDFLLSPNSVLFDFVVGNPPYVRQELIPAPLLAEYRSRYQSMYDRADLYIPFIERSLSLLNSKGTLGFICSDRWMKNRYGGPLREYISRNFYLKAYVDMYGTDAFQSEVSAYPAITILTKLSTNTTRIAHQPKIEEGILSDLSRAINSDKFPESSDVREMAGIVDGSNPWILDSSDQLSLLRRIEDQFPTLEQAGCKIGIGVATGSDKAFIGDYESMDVEPDRKLPLVTTKDIASGEIVWQGKGVINPFSDTGNLVDLKTYPKLASYLENRREIIENRHCAKKNPQNWYRTIDRIDPNWTFKQKLLIPDIKGEAHIVFESGKFYPHHNLYYVVSDDWDLRALQAVLLSRISKLFITTYSTKIRGGYFRFQAQYLRRIRIPYWQKVPEYIKKDLVNAAVSRDIEACNKLVFKLFGLNDNERAALGGNGE
jgi:hypothetical protein